MFDWTVTPNSRISKIHPSFLQKYALFVRNICCLFKMMLSGMDLLKFNPYRNLMRKGYAEAIDLAMAYIRNADVLGDVGEFGTHGVTASIIAKQLTFFKSPKNLHLFDSFDGFPEPEAKEDLESPHVKFGVWRKGTSAGPRSVLKVRRMLKGKISPRQLKIYKGYYKDTLLTISPETKFAMLLMDCCLYLSHYQVLTYCLEHNMISEGAIVLFSDWDANRASPNFGSRKTWEDVQKKFSIVFSNAGTYCWGGQKFIIHSYEKRK